MLPDTLPVALPEPDTLGLPEAEPHAEALPDVVTWLRDGELDDVGLGDGRSDSVAVVVTHTVAVPLGASLTEAL